MTTNFRNLRELNLSTFKENAKITISKFSDFGYPIAIQLKVHSVVLKDYAQYRDCLYIVGTPKGKRKLRGYLLKPNDSFTIFENFVELNETKTIDKSSENVTVISLGRCFDMGTLKQSLSIDSKIIFTTISKEEI